MKQLPLDWITGSAGSQRWNNRRDSFVLPASAFNPSRTEVVAIPEKMAKDFVLRHHYSSSYPVARFRAGLMVKPAYAREYLGGVAVFSVPMQSAAIPKYLDCDHKMGVELGRLVLLDDALLGFNAESWFVARAFRLLRTALGHLAGVISYTDPIARYSAQGDMIKPGHAGTVYKALNATYEGRASPRTLVVSRDGRVVSERAISKIRRGKAEPLMQCGRCLKWGRQSAYPLKTGHLILIGRCRMPHSAASDILVTTFSVGVSNLVRPAACSTVPYPRGPSILYWTAESRSFSERSPASSGAVFRPASISMHCSLVKAPR